MNEYTFELTGVTPLLMHADDVMASDDLMAWRKAPGNKSVSVPGDDRSPAWTWLTYLYHDGEHVAVPADNIMCALRSAGAKISNKGKSTFKALSQSGLFIRDEYCEFLVGGRRIAMADVIGLRDEPTFSSHAAACKAAGFDLLTKRARVGTSKHIRVRPRFADWSVCGTIEVSEVAISAGILSSMFDIAGRLVGLGDWRPGSPSSPGRYGMFSSKMTAVGARRRAV